MELAATKLRPPAAPRQLVLRPRLDDILDAGMENRARLFLLSAPAGSGKSTLLATWLDGRAEAVAWLQAEQSDSDPARFWAYLVEAIRQAHPITAGELNAIVVGSKGDDLAIVSALVNQLADITDRLFVVIDDFHLIDNEGVLRGVERFIDLCPAQVTVVLSTRIDPPFRLARLRVRNQIAEIRADDLRFLPDEASQLLETSGKGLDRAHLDQLCEHTEGWAAGLVLAGLSLERVNDSGAFVESFGGDDRFVVEYLRDELLANVDTTHRLRLLQTSVLNRLTGPLVDAVTGGTGGAQWLFDTARVNQLVISLDHTGTWFRYHHLFRDLLRSEAQNVIPEQMAHLHAQAAAWCESQGDLEQAIVHRLAGGDARAAADLLLILGPRLLMDGQVDTLRGFLNQLGDVAQELTWCWLLYGWCDYLAGEYTCAEGRLTAMLDMAPQGFDESVGTSLRINIALARGDVALALEAARQVIGSDQLSTHPADLATATGAALAWAGMAGEARRVLRFATKKAVSTQFPTAHILALVYQAIVELDAGTTTTAFAAGTAAVAAAERVGLAAYHGVAPAFAVRARTHTDPDQARADALHAVALARRSSTDLALGYVLTTCADTLLGIGDTEGGPLLSEARAVLDRCADPGIAGRYLDRVESRHGIPQAGRRPAVGLEQLTGREMAVLRYLPTHMTQRDIAAELFVSLNTVKTHCSAIYRKLGVDDRKAAVQAARDGHLL